MANTSQNSELFVAGEDCVGEIAGLKTQFDVFRFLKRLTESFQARAFMVVHLPGKTSLALSSNSVINNWPVELLALYDQESLLSNSPVLKKLRVSTAPFAYDTVETSAQRHDGKSDLILSLFERFNMPRGAYFPVHDFAGGRGAISFCGDRAPFSFEEMTILAYYSAHIYDRLAAIRHQDVRVTDSLTEREIDCLNWTAAGKTSAEIAEILKLSEHTVNHYLNRATKKLDTVNRTQAVAKALRVGIIK